MPDFALLLEKRRSIRDYEDKEVSLATLKEIIRESCLAPSSGNGQPWRFIIINDKAVIKILSDESKRNLLAYLVKNPDSSSKQYEAVLRDPNFNVFYNAPCLVYIIGRSRIQLNSSLGGTSRRGRFYELRDRKRGIRRSRSSVSSHHT